jgi:hypothetical protein
VPAIALRFRTTGNDLMSVNDMATADVAAGDIIVVPLPGELSWIWFLALLAWTVARPEMYPAQSLSLRHSRAWSVG